MEWAVKVVRIDAKWLFLIEIKHSTVECGKIKKGTILKITGGYKLML